MENCKPLHGTQGYHFLKATASSTIAYGKNSIFTDPSRVLANKEMRPVPIANAAAPAIVPVNQNAAAVEANILAPNEPQPPECNPADFVYVKLVTGRNTGLFVAQISSILPDGIDVTFLRKSGSDGQTFAYPVIVDRAVILVDEILEILSFPRLDKRSRYIFTKKIKVTLWRTDTNMTKNYILAYVNSWRDLQSTCALYSKNITRQLCPWWTIHVNNLIFYFSSPNPILILSKQLPCGIFFNSLFPDRLCEILIQMLFLHKCIWCIF